MVLVGGAAAGWTTAIGRLRALGARDLLVVATEGAQDVRIMPFLEGIAT